MERCLVLMGLGYSGEAIAREALRCGFRVTATKRDVENTSMPTETHPQVISFYAASEAIANATHLITTIPPTDVGDPVLHSYEYVLRQARNLGWVGYISTTGVYGDRAGKWVDETTLPRPGNPRSRRRLAAEDAWRRVLAGRAALDLFRTGGIYGPSRNVFDNLRAGTARRIVRPGQAFSRIHRRDIALAVITAASSPSQDSSRILHLVDDDPAESGVVMEEAARLLGIPSPPAIAYEEAAVSMSLMAKSFWEENRRVANQRTKAELGVSWHYPTFREGLRAILLEECFNNAP